MSEPGHVLEEAARLLDTLRRQLGGERTAPNRRPATDDVWGRATWQEPVHHIATGAPECLYCPVCRAIAAAREARDSRSDLVGRAAGIGQSVVDLLRESLASYDQPPTGEPEPTPTGFSTPAPRNPEPSPERGASDVKASEVNASEAVEDIPDAG